MHVQVTHVLVHSPEQTREIIKEATAIANEQTSDLLSPEIVFSKAVELLGARFTMAVPQESIPIPAHLLKPGLS